MKVLSDGVRVAAVRADTTTVGYAKISNKKLYIYMYILEVTLTHFS
jgi:hypothetical protein